MGGGDRSAYELLGLEPGAGREAIEQAYRRLIKLYHPDREGGDPLRAAEITQAYRELRGHRSPGAELEFYDRPPAGPTSAGWQIIALSIAIVLLSLAILAGGPLDTGFGPRSAGAPVRSAARQPPLDSPIERPIDLDALEATVAEVRGLFRSEDEMQLADLSRECHQAFRQSPDVQRFDRCVAFDDAVIILQDRDPLRDQGPFREVAVVRRHWSEGMALTNDSWALDSRLDRIRLRVELMLAPKADPPAEKPAIAASDSIPEIPEQ